MKGGNFILINSILKNTFVVAESRYSIQNVELILDVSLGEKNLKPSYSKNVVTWQENRQHRVSNMSYMFLGNFNTKYLLQLNQAVLLKSNIHSK